MDTTHGVHTGGTVARASTSGELVAGDCAVACPVFGPGGVAIAAIELQVGNLRRDVELCRATLDVTARGLSRELSLPSMEAGDRPGLRQSQNRGLDLR